MLERISAKARTTRRPLHLEVSMLPAEVLSLPKDNTLPARITCLKAMLPAVTVDVVALRSSLDVTTILRNKGAMAKVCPKSPLDSRCISLISSTSH